MKRQSRRVPSGGGKTAPLQTVGHRLIYKATSGQGFFYRSVPRGIPRLPPLPLGYGNGTER
jgi:hypothetical protein